MVCLRHPYKDYENSVPNHSPIYHNPMSNKTFLDDSLVALLRSNQPMTIDEIQRHPGTVGSNLADRLKRLVDEGRITKAGSRDRRSLYTAPPAVNTTNPFEWRTYVHT